MTRSSWSAILVGTAVVFSVLVGRPRGARGHGAWDACAWRRARTGARRSRTAVRRAAPRPARKEQRRSGQLVRVAAAGARPATMWCAEVLEAGRTAGARAAAGSIEQDEARCAPSVARSAPAPCAHRCGAPGWRARHAHRLPATVRPCAARRTAADPRRPCSAREDGSAARRPDQPPECGQRRAAPAAQSVSPSATVTGPRAPA